MQFEVIREDERGDQRHEDAAHGAAGGNRKIVAREAAGSGAQPEDLAMADHAGDEQRAEVERRERGDVRVRLRGVEVVHDRTEESDEQREPEAAVIPARAVEADDERQQVEAERQHPEEGHHGDVLAELVGDREEQHHAAGGQGEPEQFACQGRRLFDVVVVGRLRVGPWAMPYFVPAPARESGVEGEADRPTVGLRLARELRFEDERIGEQREERADVGKGVKAIRRDAWVGLAEPRLQQRAGGGEDKVWQAEAGQQEQ